eukprot:8798791-Pyramimonas_sp.AAC.1
MAPLRWAYVGPAATRRPYTRHRRRGHALWRMYQRTHVHYTLVHLLDDVPACTPSLFARAAATAGFGQLWPPRRPLLRLLLRFVVARARAS